MGGRRVTIRVLGIVSSARGFAFSAVDNGMRLVDCGGRHAVSSEKTAENIDAILRSARPLFVAIEDLRTSRKRARAASLNEAIVAACGRHNIMVLIMAPHELAAVVERKKPTRHDIAERVARWFPEIGHKLPRRRAVWEGEDSRLGLFIAVATTLAAWRRFARRRG